MNWWFMPEYTRHHPSKWRKPQKSSKDVYKRQGYTLCAFGAGVACVSVLAQRAHGSGLSLIHIYPSGDIEIAVTGLRPGEKLFEELLIEGKAVPTEHPRILRKEEGSMAMEDLRGLLGKLERACDRGDIDAVFALLHSPFISFAPRTGIKDILWNEQCHSSEKHLKVAF